MNGPSTTGWPLIVKVAALMLIPVLLSTMRVAPTSTVIVRCASLKVMRPASVTMAWVSGPTRDGVRPL